MAVISGVSVLRIEVRAICKGPSKLDKVTYLLQAVPGIRWRLCGRHGLLLTNCLSTFVQEVSSATRLSYY